MTRDVNSIVGNPTIVIEDTLSDLEKQLNGDTIGSNHTTAFHNLIESSRSLSADALIGTSNIIRKKFVNLASTMDDLFFNIHDEVKDNLFAIAGTAPIAFYINLLDLKQYGIKENGSYITTISSGTKITVLDTVFTLLNDIVITIKDNNLITIEQKESELDIAVNDLGLLKGTIYTDSNGIEWILFETVLKNITKTTSITPINHTGNLIVKLPLTLKYSTIDIYFIDNSKKNKIRVTYSDTYLDENFPTALVALTTNEVVVTIPSKYLIDNEIRGKLFIDLYETNGEKTLDISRLAIEDFTLELPEKADDNYKATAVNIIMLNTSRGVLNNGVDSMTFDELKEAIINSTLGDIDLPITSNQISRKANMLGYDLRVTEDSLLGREFTASKPVPNINTDMIHAFPDLFFNQATIVLSEEVSNKYISKFENLFVIQENCLFKVENKGIISVVEDSEIELIESLNNDNKIVYLRENNIFFTPLTYSVNYEKDITNSEVYYLKPSINSIRIAGTNRGIKEKINTDKYDIVKTPTGYRLYLQPILNNELASKDLDKLYARIHFNISGTTSTVYFDAEYDIVNNLFIFDIKTGELYKNLFELTNGAAILKDVRVKLEDLTTVYLYTTDENIIDTENYLLSEFGKINSTRVTIFNKEILDITLGIKLDYIYSNIITMFTNNQYKRHSVSIPLTYEEDVYRKFENGLIVNPVKNGNGSYNMNMDLLHKKGDPVVDENGNPFYKSIAGDIVYDEKGNPIIDKVSGIKRVMTVMMLEYEFLATNNETYQNFLKIYMSNVMNMVSNDMITLNRSTMDVTKIKYRTFRNIKNVPVIVNNVYYPIEYSVKPKVTLILSKNTIITSNDTLDNIKAICGKIISKYLHSSKIIMKTIRDEILSTLPISVIGMKIENIEPKNSEVIVTTNDNRFTIAKTLEATETNTTIVKYNINLEVEYI